MEELRSKKAALEKTIEEMQAQIAGLSFFKFGLKKELTQKVESARANLPQFTEKIRKTETECDDIKKKCNSEISALQQNIYDKKRELDKKRTEHAGLPEQRRRLDSNIANAEKKVDDIKAQIALIN